MPAKIDDQIDYYDGSYGCYYQEEEQTYTTAQVRLPTGRVIPLSDVKAGSGGNYFYNGLNVTPYLTRAQQLYLEGYDTGQVNVVLSDEKARSQGRKPVVVGSTSVWDNFTAGVGDDVKSLEIGRAHV